MDTLIPKEYHISQDLPIYVEDDTLQTVYIQKERVGFEKRLFPGVIPRGN